MLTDLGKPHIKRRLATIDIARAIGIGVGGVAESAAHTKLEFEVDRFPITLQSYDFVNNLLIFKATVPQELPIKIYEVGLFSQPQSTSGGEFTSRMLTQFDSNLEIWSAGAFNSTNTRIGIDSLRLTPSASATTTALMSDIFLDLSGNSAADTFVLAFNNTNANVANIRFRFKTDASNYYTFTVASPTTTGYRVVSHAKSTATATGTPSWANITGIEVEVVATGGGSATVDFDGLRIEDIDSINPDFVMVSRELLASPITKLEGRVQDIEYSLAVTI